MNMETSTLKQNLDSMKMSLEEIDSDITSLIDRFKRQEKRIKDMQRILRPFVKSIVTIKDNEISTEKTIKLKVFDCVDFEQYKPLLKKQKNNEIELSNIEDRINTEMVVYIKSLLEEINDSLKFDLYLVSFTEISGLTLNSDTICRFKIAIK